MYDKLETRTFLLLLLAVSCVFAWLLKPFFGAIFWACAVAVIFYPVQNKMLQRWPSRPNLAALATLCLCILVVILPVVFVVSSVVTQGFVVFDKLQSGEINPAHYLELIHDAFPSLQATLRKFGIDLGRLKEEILNVAMTSGKFLAQHTLSVGQNAFQFIFSLVLMLYITFFMLRDGSKLVDLLMRALPLGDDRERILFALFAEVTRATIKGNMVIAVVQGTIGGLTLWALDVDGALLWGGVMAFASLIPAVGSALVWVPVALYLAAIGETSSALILVGIGVAIIGTLDNILRPILVGRDTKLPDYLVLLSTLGGIGLFGVNGFVIGPLVAALFIAFWKIFIREVHILVPDVEQSAVQSDTPPTHL
jgi:predicted PurR-regulated permease PerM